MPGLRLGQNRLVPSTLLGRLSLARPPAGKARRPPDPKPPAPPDAWRRTLRLRVLGVTLGLVAWTLGIQARLVYLQVAQHDVLVARAERQQMRTITVPAKRGEIVDRRGRVLAYSVDADSIYAVPTEIEHPERVASALCSAMGDCTGAEQRRLVGRLRRPRAFAYVRRQVARDAVARVARLNLQGIGFLKENRRYYPKRHLAAHLLGYVGIDHSGLGGVESAYDDQIRGRPGKILIQIDARRRAFSRVERPPTVGANLALTIDQNLQYIAERELREAVQTHRAAGGTVVMMDPHSGELLALANEPTFNPNAFGRTGDVVRRNRATQEIYEPGSTFKVVTASAALETGVMDPQDSVDVSAGLIRFGSRVVRDVYRYDKLSFADVIVKSSNVGAIKVGLAVGADRLGRYVHRFGFGQLLSPDFRGESPGIVWNPESLTDSALASVSMGYQIGVTPLQMVTAVSAIANGGLLLEPRTVGAFAQDGVRVPVGRRVIRRAVEPGTAAMLTTIMEAVVERGTGHAARLGGYTVAGKTGTAAKVVDGRYSKTDYFSSFVGFVPSRDPELTILVVIDTPRGDAYYGGAVAAPVFGRIAEAALRYLRVPPTLNPAPPVLVSRARTEAARPVRTHLTVSSPPAPVGLRQPGSGMPDLRGMSARRALLALARFGAEARLVGDGFVVAQVPEAGSEFVEGAACTLWLQRERGSSAPEANRASP